MNQEKGFKRESELSCTAYFSEDYFNKYQLFSLSEQISLLYKYSKLIHNPKILEIGKGNGFVSDFFKKANFEFKTFDINETLKPDIVGNIVDLSSFIEIKPDLILCSEVLEHIEFDLFEKSLKELSLVSNKYVLITLPEFKKFFGVNLQLRLPKLKVFSIPLFVKIKGNTILGSGHFWEIDYDKKSRRKNIEKIIKTYFDIVEKGTFHTNPYHNFYVLQKIINKGKNHKT
jgi:hypothetical protein